MVEALPRRHHATQPVAAAADSVFKHRWEGLAAEVAINAFPLPRGGWVRPAMEELRELLRERWSLVIFPEGRLSRTGAIGTFRRGAALLAREVEAPVVPAYIDGLYSVLPRRRHVPHPGRARLTFGDPMRPQPGENDLDFTARIEAAVRGLAGDKGRAHDPPAPAGAVRAEGSDYGY
jgi:1-acyl-sn-glycerol-3-phosphate acyltransferase